jgi:hypothetical protein
MSITVLSPVTDKTPVDLIADFRLKTRDVRKTPLDLLACNHDRFYHYAANPASFEHEIAESVVLIYEHR